MPLFTLHLLSLANGVTRESVVKQLKTEKPAIEVVVASRPRHFVIRPEKKDVSHLTQSQWDLMLLLKTTDGELPTSVKSKTTNEYKVAVGIPSKLLASYPERNGKLLKDSAKAPLTGSLDKARVPDSSQNLELSPELLRFMDDLMKEHDGPVTMLNLLHFKQGGKPSYYQYGQGFIEVAGKRGGDAKIVGNVVKPPAGWSDSRGDSNQAEDEWWNEISIVHYPSIKHFCDMLAGDDYQEINEKYRLKALEDTILLCTTELGLETLHGKAKL